MGGRGSGLRAGAAGSVNESTSQVSPTSTGGRLVDQGGGQWYGENDNGYAVAILDGGSDDINMYRYGSRRIYEVHEYMPDGSKAGETRYVPTKREAERFARDYLRSHR